MNLNFLNSHEANYDFIHREDTLCIYIYILYLSREQIVHNTSHYTPRSCALLTHERAHISISHRNLNEMCTNVFFSTLNYFETLNGDGTLAIDN